MIDAIEFPKQLKNQLCQTLPGKAAQRSMAPEFAFGRHRGPIAFGVHRAAVCLCLYRHDDRWWIPLTLRSKQLADHAGQISLPGGRIEINEGAWQAARREFREELGCEVGEDNLIGQLTPLYVYGSHHHVEVFVAALNHRPIFNPEESEVAEVIMMSLGDLLELNNQVIATMQRGAARFDAPGYRVGKNVVWGATAMILAEFAEVASKILEPANVVGS
ncbi:MAG: CoA pyrophosphatase [Pirellulaceae bacterium]|nr:CoA pyrophosphatase [Pirellulaceae bacterium]